MRHQKVRFRPAEIVDLSSLPSADGHHAHWRIERNRKRATKFALIIAGTLCVAALALVALVSLVGLTGFGDSTLRQEAQAKLQLLAGDRVQAAVGPASIALQGIEITNVSLASGPEHAPFLKANSVRFGVQVLPLLTGALRLGDATIADAEIDLAKIPAAQTDWTASMRDSRGLLDPDRVLIEAFKPLYAAFDAFRAGRTGTIALENVRIALPSGEEAMLLTIVDGEIAETDDGHLTLSGNLELNGRPLTLIGDAVQDSGGHIGSLSITLAGDGADERSTIGSFSQSGPFNLALTGAETSEGARLSMSGDFKSALLDFGKKGTLPADFDVMATLASGSGKIEFDRISITSGGTTFELNGAFGPQPSAEQADGPPVYRYELVSSQVRLAPANSPEAPANVALQAAGILDGSRKLLQVDRFALRSAEGSASGTAAVQFETGQVPGLQLDLAVQSMPVAIAKQIWPWFSAEKARQWVLEHLSGGTLHDGVIAFKVAPGRLGNGIPITNDEITAHFELAGTRFDTAGMLPPVRDAVGAVDVRGNDFDVTLTQGSAFLPSGKVVLIDDGSLKVVKANIQPVVGRLDMDVSGDASALAELASLEPLNALRTAPVAASDLGGAVKGKVVADIPLQKGVDPKSLQWTVSLDFKGLSVAKPFAGQILKDATGTLWLDPGQAILSAKGKLNGAPADIELTEPLRDSGVDRALQVSLTVDDKTREAVAPGLSSFVKGPMVLAYRQDKDGNAVDVDLTNADLSLPWVGWSKGAGVAASAGFSLEQNDGLATLDDFRVSGKTFDIRGKLATRNGSLSSAHFDTFSLNRGDQLKIDVDRSASGLRVDVNGASVDARPLIKKYVSGGFGPDPSATTAAKTPQVPIKVAVRIDQATGFNGEVFSDLSIDYDGAGASLNGLAMRANSAADELVALDIAGRDGRRTIQASSPNAGAALKFLNLYSHVAGGSIKLNLASRADGVMSGQIDARDFTVVDEPKLASLVSSKPPGSDRSLNDAVKKGIDTQRVRFERGFARLEKGDDYLRLQNGVLRGSQIGATFQGIVYDGQSRMDMTGTFMPAYGVNRLFGEIPLVGLLLGNGSDRGLIGLTFRLSGNADAPLLQLNPLSVIAPGIFRSIFEFQ